MSARRLDVGLWYFKCSATATFLLPGRSPLTFLPPVFVLESHGSRRPSAPCGACSSVSWFPDMPVSQSCTNVVATTTITSISENYEDSSCQLPSSTTFHPHRKAGMLFLAVLKTRTRCLYLPDSYDPARSCSTPYSVTPPQRRTCTNKKRYTKRRVLIRNPSIGERTNNFVDRRRLP